MNDAAETIWLQDPDGCGAVSFCNIQVNADDHEYVRKDLCARTDPLDDPRVKALVERIQKLRQIMSDHIIEREGPHTVTLDDGTTHTGPVVDFLHQLVGLQIRALDHALAAMKGGGA